jgi:tetratricopeptide (TPR) repeat protein
MWRNCDGIFPCAWPLPNLPWLGYSSGMKRIAALLILLLAAGWLTARAQQSADSQYLKIYSNLQQADGLDDAGDLRLALAEYTEAQMQLRAFQSTFPDWNPEIVTFRLKYLAGKIAGLTAQLPPPVVVATNTVINPVSVVAPAAADAELAALRGQFEAVQSENATLLAKLKEALSAQPPPADAGALVRAQEQVRALMKENDLLKAGAVAGNAGTGTDTNAPAALREENAQLKSQLAILNNSATNALEIDRLGVDLKQARQQIATLQSAAQASQLENAALENRIQQLQTNASAPKQQDNEARIRELTQERDDLLAKLGAANKQLHGTKKADAAAQLDQSADQIRTLRERLAVAEAQPSPYTPEELALLKSSAPQLAADASQKKSIKQLPAGSAGLVAEAQSFFIAKQYDRAEADYLKILQSDGNNALVLGNLAAIEMQEGKLDDAEKHIRAALAQDPNDAFNLATLGYLKFRQEKFDEALDVLSRAAKLDPQNPEIQNYLGVTLSHKGLRPQAEAALRKAIELNPDYAAAHNNLAAIYISATPPLVELARWHYQKALQAGQPHNPELEKALAEKGAPAAP